MKSFSLLLSSPIVAVGGDAQEDAHEGEDEDEGRPGDDLVVDAQAVAVPLAVRGPIHLQRQAPVGAGQGAHSCHSVWGGANSSTTKELKKQKQKQKKAEEKYRFFITTRRLIYTKQC